MSQDGKPTFVGNPQEAELAARVFDLMLLQGQSFSGDAPIRQSLQALTTHFLDREQRTDQAELEQLLDRALRKNPQVFYREVSEGTTYYVTTKNGRYTPVIRPRTGFRLPVITSRHISGGVAARPPVADAPEPQFFPHDMIQIGDLKDIIKQPQVRDTKEPAPRVREPRAPRQPAAPPAPAKRVPQVLTPQGTAINLSKSPSEILSRHKDFFLTLLRDRLATDNRFVSIGNQWFLTELLAPLAKGELRQVREFIEASGGSDTDANLCTNVFNKQPAADPAFCFSLNYHLANEKKVFEFVGTPVQSLWWLAGRASPRIVRTALKAAEVGQDLKYLEDEAPVTKLAGAQWQHSLTFYEWENGILPYTPTAKLLLPPPLLKDQKVAQLRFEAPQFETSAYAELHYPAGNRGGWIEGLGEILAVFVSGARLTVAAVPDKPDTFSISYTPRPAQEVAVLLYDQKRQRFLFQPLPLSYEVDPAYLLDRQSFAALKDARRLEEANRRKGDPVIIYAFEKIGEKSTRDDKPVYRARLEQLLPIINIEKPFSQTSLLRFFTTHPHYQKDETEEGFYLYTPDRD